MFDNSVLKRAKTATVKKHCCDSRPRHWIQRPLLEQIVRWHGEGQQNERFKLTQGLAYAFLLRLPSEALPDTAGRDSGTCSLYWDGGRTDRAGAALKEEQATGESLDAELLAQAVQSWIHARMVPSCSMACQQRTC